MLEQVCKSIQWISLLCIMPKVSLYEYYKSMTLKMSEYWTVVQYLDHGPELDKWSCSWPEHRTSPIIKSPHYLFFRWGSNPEGFCQVHANFIDHSARALFRYFCSGIFGTAWAKSWTLFHLFGSQWRSWWSHLLLSLHLQSKGR